MLAEDSRLRRRGHSLRVSSADALAFSLIGSVVLNDLVRIRADRCFEFPGMWYAENSSIAAYSNVSTVGHQEYQNLNSLYRRTYIQKNIFYTKGPIVTRNR